jgi:hypothetical protein|tara:strand:+ start:225 stop:416 length:192 start_codon:yes stop_codon:yes gene_type:complete
LEAHPEIGEEVMKILATLYNNPMKVSQVPEFVEKMAGVEKKEEGLADQLKGENSGLQMEIFDL